MNYCLPFGQFRHLLRIDSRVVSMFYQTIMISTRIRTGSHSSSARSTISCVLFCWLCPVRAFCDILLKARRSKIHTAILNILHIRNKTIVTGRVQRCNADT